MLKTSAIRTMFLDYFKSNMHTVVQSGSLVPQGDNTLLFTNAGMVQFKDVFIGLEKRGYTRATTSQKCVRAGGKHNDLDQVGFTARHHTFFEMLGNFSFGDYFKNEAIEFAWNFITKELKIDKSRLLATVYHTDDEAASIWRRIAGPDFRIIPIKTNDNFWAMGDTGPCGPCSEIFFDHGEHIPGGVPGSSDEDGDRFVEIWNIVFMQYEQMANGDRVPLKAKSIDTGMGLERIAAVMQKTPDNYDTDIFKAIMQNAQDLLGTGVTAENKPSFKVIADHLRSLSFLITDGVFPSNEGRGYVLRRILRRAVRHAHMLGAKGTFMHRLVPCLVDQMKDAYPELDTMQKTIASTIQTEEEKFLTTLDNGLSILNDEIVGLPSGGVLRGEIAFKLYDTYGFPLDLTQDILKAKGITVDEPGFQAAMQEQRNRANWKNSSYDKATEAVFFDIKQQVKEQEFVGYEELSTKAKIIDIVVDGQRVESIDDGKACIITDRTAFYSECGGQVGDIGEIKKPLGTFVVENTRKVGELIIHEGYVKDGMFSVNENVTTSVCCDSRRSTAGHHTATHLLQAALKHVLGAHVAQKGSYVCKDYLRFDFSHPTAMTDAEIIAAEDIVNRCILSNYPVSKEIMSKCDAVRAGATALFGEKYGDTVRVVSIKDGESIVSSELCGGTHVNNTGEIGLFKIISEASIGSGLRRIEAIAGTPLQAYIRQMRNKIDDLNRALKTSDDGLLEKVESIIANTKDLEKELIKTKTQLAIANTSCEAINGIELRICQATNLSAKDMRPIVDKLIRGMKSGVVIMYNIAEDKVNVVTASTKEIGLAKLVLDNALKPLDGHGGGKSEFAQGGGVDPTRVGESIKSARQFIESL